LNRIINKKKNPEMERLNCFFPDFLFEIIRKHRNLCKNHQTAFSLTFFGKRILPV